MPSQLQPWRPPQLTEWERRLNSVLLSRAGNFIHVSHSPLVKLKPVTSVKDLASEAREAHSTVLLLIVINNIDVQIIQNESFSPHHFCLFGLFL